MLCTLTPALYCAGLIWYKRVTGVFIEPHRASPPLHAVSPFQPRHRRQPCSLTGKAIMSAHQQHIACCANRFVSPLWELDVLHYAGTLYIPSLMPYFTAPIWKKIVFLSHSDIMLWLSLTQTWWCNREKHRRNSVDGFLFFSLKSHQHYSSTDLT